jgi:signal peptidase I
MAAMAAARASAAGQAAPEPPEPSWGRVLRIVVARAALALVVSLVVWSLLPLLAGWTPRVILSGSMEPRIHVGDIVVTRTVPGASVTKGQVITVKDPDHPEKTRTHRVLRRASDGTIVTRGDANPQADSSHISDDDVLGVGVVRVPFVGRPAYWMAEHNWLALGATTLFLGWCVMTVMPSSRRDEDTDDDGDRPSTGSGPTRFRRPRRIAATVAVAAAAVCAVTGPADAAFKLTAANPVSTLSAAASFASASYSATVIADVPQFFWRLGESSGSSAADAKNGRTGQLNGAYTWGRAGAITTQPSNTALGVDGGYVNQPAALASGNTFSVETWLRTTRSTGGGLVSLIASSGPERSLYMGNDGKVRFGLNGTALVTSSKALNDGAWHHVVYTNASTGSQRAKLYVDGSLDKQGSASVTVSKTGNWRAGQAQWNSSWEGNPDQFFRGDLDEVAVYTTALTAQKISNHYNAS